MIDAADIVQSYKLYQWLRILSFYFRKVVRGRTLELILHDRPWALTPVISVACKTTELSFRDIFSSMNTLIETAENCVFHSMTQEVVSSP